MLTQFVTIVPHLQENHFSSQDNEEATTKYTHTHTRTHTLSNTAHQLSSSCHGCRQPGSGIYSQSIQNGPCHFYWISHQQKGQLRWWVLVGGQLKKNRAHQANYPCKSVHCPLCGLAHVGGIYCAVDIMLLPRTGTVGRQVVCSDYYFEGDQSCAIK